MVQLSGKYKLVENKNFYEFLLGLGLPDAEAKKANEIAGTVEVTVDGSNFTMEHDTPPHVNKLVIDKEVDEKLVNGVVLKSTAAVSGNVITITSKTTEDQPAGSRILTFSDSGLEVVTTAIKEGKTHKATRIYKRM